MTEFEAERQQVKDAMERWGVAVSEGYGIAAERMRELEKAPDAALGSLVAAVRAEERSRVTVEQIAEILHDRSCPDPTDCRRPGHPSVTDLDTAAAVHRLITGETP